MALSAEQMDKGMALEPSNRLDHSSSRGQSATPPLRTGPKRRCCYRAPGVVTPIARWEGPGHRLGASLAAALREGAAVTASITFWVQPVLCSLLPVPQCLRSSTAERIRELAPLRAVELLAPGRSGAAPDLLEEKGHLGIPAAIP